MMIDMKQCIFSCKRQVSSTRNISNIQRNGHKNTDIEQQLINIKCCPMKN